MKTYTTLPKGYTLLINDTIKNGDIVKMGSKYEDATGLIGCRTNKNGEYNTAWTAYRKQSNPMKITHNNQEYTLNVEKAINDGYLTPSYVCTNNEVWESENKIQIVIIEHTAGSNNWLIGNVNDGLVYISSNYPRTALYIINHLETGKFKRVGQGKFSIDK